MPPLAAPGDGYNGDVVVVAPVDDELAKEAEELDGYFSDTPLDPKPVYPELNETSFASAIIITNLPQVPEAKVDKLTKVVHKLVTKIGPLQQVINEEDGTEIFSGLYMPFDESTGTTLGFCFVEYTTVEFAKQAVEVLQSYKLDKNHSIEVTLYDRAQHLQDVTTEEFVEPQIPPFEASDAGNKPNPSSWLEDDNQRDQFITRFGKETAVHWWDSNNATATLDYDGAREKEAGVNWCDYYCFWSTSGSYLATLVPPKGVILWSGSNYEKIGRYIAPGVKIVVFSPQENYLLTNNEDPRDPFAIKVYHIATAKLLRAFPLYPDNVPTNVPPPPFLWSHDDKYLARMGKDLISIFETPGMKLLDQRSLATDGIHEFQWSPKANVLAYWAPEQNNSPAHVDLIEIPSRNKLRQKNLFNVTRCNIVWQDQGHFLAVKVTRHTKSKKTLYNNIELFRLNEVGIPVEMLDTKDAVMALQFEPKGSRFAMIHAENPAAAKVKVSFYDMIKLEEQTTVVTNAVVGLQSKTKKTIKKIPELNLIETLDGRQCNFISWSPAGGVIIMASLGDSASGTLEFYDVLSKTMVVKEHYRCNQVSWDPSGRTVASIVSQPIGGGNFKFAMDNGYIIWSFQGKQLMQQSFETFYQFLWRPRDSLLSPNEIEKVRRNLKKYEKQFDKADRQRQRAMYLQETAGKRSERNKYRELLARNKAIRAQSRREYVASLGGYDSEDDSNFRIAEVTIEAILSRKEEVVHA